MTRPPLELLELLIRANAAAQEPGEANADLAAEFVAVMADPATGEQLRALRAQAEAGAAVDRGTHADWVMLAWLGHVDREQVLYRHISSWELAQKLRLPAFDIEEAQLRAFRTELTALGKGWVGDWRQIVLTPAGRKQLAALRADFCAAAHGTP